MRIILGILVALISLPALSLTEEELQEIELASQAAPSSITKHASFMMFKNGEFVLLKKGENNFFNKTMGTVVTVKDNI